MTKSKYIILIVITALIATGAFVYLKAVAPFYRLPGDRGGIYETWETDNKAFKVKITAYYEVGIFMPGAFFVLESAPSGSEEWRHFLTYRADDAVKIPQQRFKFVNEQTAYFYGSDDFLVTVNGGREWSVWKPILKDSDGKIHYWAITEADVELNGTGKLELRRYDEQLNAKVIRMAFTENYGRSWDIGD
jgi:hypothetical protein